MEGCRWTEAITSTWHNIRRPYRICRVLEDEWVLTFTVFSDHVHCLCLWMYVDFQENWPPTYTKHNMPRTYIFKLWKKWARLSFCIYSTLKMELKRLHTSLCQCIACYPSRFTVLELMSCRYTSITSRRCKYNSSANCLLHVWLDTAASRVL